MSAFAQNINISKVSAPAFLEKLYEILTDVSNNPYIAWQADGSSFLIKKVPELQEIVLPKYFKHNNLQSFVRQLNMYNFAKTCHDPNYREFRNPNFIKGRRDLLPLIKRKAQSAIRDVTLSNGFTNSNNSMSRRSISVDGIDVDEVTMTGETSASGSRSSSRKRTSTYKAIQSNVNYVQDNKSSRLPSSDKMIPEYMGDSSPSYGVGSDNYSSGGYDTYSHVSEDYHTLAATQDDLRWRVRQLETTNTLLMERYTSLANKHDELCSLVHSYLKTQQNRQTGKTSLSSSDSSSDSDSKLALSDDKHRKTKDEGLRSIDDLSKVDASMEAKLDAILDSRINWGDFIEMRRRRACSDMDSENISGSGSVIEKSLGNGSFDSSTSRFPDTDSDHCSESDSILGLKTSRSSPDDDEKMKLKKEFGDSPSIGSEAISMVDICDSPTYHAANILFQGLPNNHEPTPDQGLTNFVDAISTMWSAKSDNNHTSLNKHSQLSSSGMVNVHGVSMQTANNQQRVFSTLASPIQVPKAKGLIESSLGDRRGVGGGYGCLAGQPITKQISLPAPFDSTVKKQKLI